MAAKKAPKRTPSQPKKVAAKAKKVAAKAKKLEKPVRKVAVKTAAAVKRIAEKVTAKAPSRPVRAAAPAAEIGVGSSAPAFLLPDQDGKVVSSAAYAGQPYAIYFYPRDNTPGCTREACEFQGELAEFERLGVRVIGVSPDTVKSHRGFADKYKLDFTLLADSEHTLANAYGVRKMKTLYGRESLGIERSTFLVGADGRIVAAWRGVKVPDHVAAVLAAVPGAR